LDLITAVIDLLSAAVLIFLVYAGARAIRAFKQSKQAVVESASLLEVIVTALTSRVEASESLVEDLRTEFQDVSNRSVGIESEQANLRSGYHQVLEHMQEMLANDKKLVLELEQLKTSVTSIHQPAARGNVSTQGERSRLVVPTNDIMATLTPTERHTLEILSREGPKVAPELGGRMRKSREHMARLMKKLYMEGYVDRESNHAPFRYKLTERIQSMLAPTENGTTEEASEKV
jgi:DNA-binding MarR family transcriptional regulator